MIGRCAIKNGVRYMKILCLIDFPVRKGDRWLWNAIPDANDEVDFLWATARDRFAGWGKVLSYYPTFLWNAARALRRCRQHTYDLIVGWEGKNTFPLALLRGLGGIHKPPLLGLTFSLRGPIKKLLPLQRVGLRGMDWMTVSSQYDQRVYMQLSGWPENRCVLCRLGSYDGFEGLPPAPAQPYIFSGGRSGRDYATLFAALQQTTIPAVVNARPFNVRGLKVPQNVRLNDLLPADAYRNLHWGARFVVIPLQDLDEVVGLIAVLYAMAAGKAVIVSRVSCIEEYVQEGETGLLVPPGDVTAMRTAIERLWTDRETCERMGKQARERFLAEYTFSAFARRVAGVLDTIRATQ